MSIADIQVFDPERMRKLRKAAGLTVTKLAVDAGVSRVSASMWETGTTKPSFESMQRLAHALGLNDIEPLLKKDEKV